MNEQKTRSIKTSAVDYSDGTTLFEGYLAQPSDADANAPVPCVLLAHEWSGLNEGMKAIARRVASLGYACFAADVYGKGVRGSEVGDNSHLMNPLLADRELLRDRLLAGLRTAAELPFVDRSRIAAMGYCLGGLCALDLARAGAPDLRAAVSFHGALQPPDIGPQQPIRASILLLHGWEDPVAPPEAVLAIARELTDAGADWQFHAYGHALHAFTFEGVNFPERGIVYDAAADRRSWRAMQDFLAERFAT